MGAILLSLFTVAHSLSFASQHQDTLPSFANPATRALVVRGITRHREQDSAVVDYTARIRYRLTASVGRRRWGRFPLGSVEEQDATVAWHLPNDLRVDVLGRRARTRGGIPPMSSTFDRPWFVPRSVGDSVRIFSNEFPATGALHPLSAEGPAWYRYELADSLTANIPGGHRIRIYAVQFTPKRAGPALLVGRLWLDAATAEIVRFTFRYVGTELWVKPGDEDVHDSASARRVNRLVNSIVSIDADLEYALEDGKFWMPFRQTIAGRVRVPLTDIVVPFQALTSFDDYEINTGRPVVFTLPRPDTSSSDSARAARRAQHDSIRVAREGGINDGEKRLAWERAGAWIGGRYEIHRPSDDSLATYHGWTDSLTFEADPADDRRVRTVESDLAALVEGLPDEITLRKAHGFAYENMGDALRYNRVQGLSVGLGYRERVPNTDFTDLYATLRYGFSDERVTGRLSLVRDAPSGRFVFGGYRDIADVDPFSPGRTVYSSFNALFTAHDYADYDLATGGAVTFEKSLAIGLDLAVTARAERQRSVEQRARSAVNDALGGNGDFPPNPPIDDGDYGNLGVRLSAAGPWHWTLSAEGLAGTHNQASARLFGEIQRGIGGVRGATLRVKGGVAAHAVSQYLFRLGGLNTVRGFEYGALRGPAFWAAQLDVSPLKSNVRPILFIDAGQAGTTQSLFGSKALVGGGVGVSVYSPLLRSTLFRLDLSHSITPETGARWRFDIVLQAVR